MIYPVCRQTLTAVILMVGLRKVLICFLRPELEATPRIILDSMTCTVTLQNGVKIGSDFIRQLKLQTPRVLWGVLAVSFVEALGPAVPSIAARHNDEHFFLNTETT